MKLKEISFYKICDLMLERLIRFILRFNKIIILAGLLISVVCGYWLSKINIGSAIELMYPPKGDQDRYFLEKTYEIFGTDLTQTITITFDDLFSHSSLKKIQKLTSQIERFPAVDRVLSITSAPLIEEKFGVLLIKNLTSEDADFKSEGAGYLKKEGEVLAIQKISENVPQTNEKLEEFKNELLSNPLYAKNLVSEDLKSTIINVYFKRGYTWNELRIVAGQIKDLVTKSAGSNKVHIASPLDMSTTIFEMLSRDLSIYLPLTILIVMTILLISFRNWKIVFISLISLSMPIVFVYALMAVINIPIFVMTAAIPPILASQGLAYCIHLYAEYFRQRSLSDDRKLVVAQTLKKVFPAIFLSALAASIGFISIAPVNVVAVRQMGVFLAAGIIIVFLIVSFFVSSMLIYLFPKPSSHMGSVDASKRYRIERFPLFCIRHRILIFVFTALLSIVSFYGFSRLVVESDINQVYRSSSPFRQAVDFIAKKFKGASVINVIIEGRYEGSLKEPAVLKSIDELQKVLDGQALLGKSVSAVDYLKSINKAANDNDPAYYSVPDEWKMISRYLNVYSLADPTGGLNLYVDKEGKTINIALRSATSNSADIVKIKDFVEGQCDQILPRDISCTVTGDAVLIAMTAQKLSRGILYGFTQAVLMIFLLMVFWSRSVKIGLAAMVPNIAPLLFVLGVMGFAGISFNVGTSIVVCIAIGIAVDDTIHFLLRYLHELKHVDQKTAIVDTFKHEHGPITLIGVSVILGFVVLTFSQFVPMALFGVLTSLALFMGIICELIILPAILSAIKMKKKSG